MLEQIDKEEDRLIPVEDAIDFVRRELVPHFPPQPAETWKTYLTDWLQNFLHKKCFQQNS